MCNPASMQYLASSANTTWYPGPGFSNPVLLLAGDQDVVVPPENQMVMLDRIPGRSGLGPCFLVGWAEHVGLGHAGGGACA